MKKLETHTAIGAKVTRTMNLFKQKAILGPGHVFGVFWKDASLTGETTEEKQRWYPTQNNAHKFIRSLGESLEKRKEVKVHESVG
jgi:hypothetical protein